MANKTEKYNGDGNDICRRCKFMKMKERKDSVFPLYYCKEHPTGLDAVFMNYSQKKCFVKKVTGPWRMPEGMFDEEEFRNRLVLKQDEFYGKKYTKKDELTDDEVDEILKDLII